MTEKNDRKEGRRASIKASKNVDSGEPKARSLTDWLVKGGTLSRSIKFVLSIFALLLAVSILYQFTAERADTKKLEDLAHQGVQQRAALQDQADLIIDCTTPGGECYQRGQEQTARVVAGLNVVSQYSVICGERTNGEQNILDCVNQEVKQYLRTEKAQAKNN